MKAKAAAEEKKAAAEEKKAAEASAENDADDQA